MVVFVEFMFCFVYLTFLMKYDKFVKFVCLPCVSPVGCADWRSEIFVPKGWKQDSCPNLMYPTFLNKI